MSFKMNILSRKARKRLTVGVAALLASGCMLAGIIVNNTNTAWAGEYYTDESSAKASDFYYETITDSGTHHYWTSDGLKKAANQISRDGCYYDMNTKTFYDKGSILCKEFLNSLIYKNNLGNTAGTRGFMRMGNTRTDTTGINKDGSNSDGDIMQFRLIGINHDDKADGTGKAGLTFQAVQGYRYPNDDSPAIWNTRTRYMMNKSSTNYGGWRDSNYRNSMNNGNIWLSLPSDFKDNVTPVKKNNK